MENKTIQDPGQQGFEKPKKTNMKRRRKLLMDPPKLITTNSFEILENEMGKPDNSTERTGSNNKCTKDNQKSRQLW